MMWTHELRTLSDAIQIAGAEALRLAAQGFEIQIKADQSPVTSADLAVNHILQTRLLAEFPTDGWLSEESPDSRDRLEKKRVWIIDPIDGTKAFVRREPAYCISAALIETGLPVVAAIFNPSTNELFTAVRGGGLHLNHEPVPKQTIDDAQRPVVALSPWEQHIGRFKSVEEFVTCRPIHSIAWVLALAACGRIHAVATFEPENEWDVAAGTLLVEEAGGTVRDRAGQTLDFNRPDPRYRGLIAMSGHCPDPLAEQLRFLSQSSR